MKLGKCHQEGDGEEEEVLNFGAQKDLLPSTNSNKDGRNSDKSSAMRSKHSVTEQRRRCKINERFRLLRGLMPDADQKRDTASFLSEVIEYVQYLQEKVQKYEGPLQEWSSEPTKLMPWVEGEKQMEDDVNYLYIEVYDERNNHWRVRGVSDHPPSIENACDPLQKQVSDAPSANDSHNQHENIAIEGGTISISGEYSQGLLSNLTNALQSAGLDLSHASISVQINIGKRAITSKIARGEDQENPSVGGHIRNTVNGEDSDQVRKRPKI